MPIRIGRYPAEITGVSVRTWSGGGSTDFRPLTYKRSESGTLAAAIRRLVTHGRWPTNRYACKSEMKTVSELDANANLASAATIADGAPLCAKHTLSVCLKKCCESLP